jgi:hypothetical protein
LNPPPPHFIIRREEAGFRIQTWSVWRGSERVGELEGDEDIGWARVRIWGRSKSIGNWGGESPADKFQKWIVTPGAAEWVEACRLAHLKQ